MLRLNRRCEDYVKQMQMMSKEIERLLKSGRLKGKKKKEREKKAYLTKKKIFLC
jgi:hypothetical protein